MCAGCAEVGRGVLPAARAGVVDLAGIGVLVRQLQGESQVAFPFAAGWADYGSGFEGASYSRHGRVVTLQGLVTKSGGTPAVNDVIGTLPPGFRPTATLIFPTASGQANQFGRVQVTVAGEVVWLQGGATETDYTSLSGISFVVG